MDSALSYAVPVPQLVLSPTAPVGDVGFPLVLPNSHPAASIPIRTAQCAFFVAQRSSQGESGQDEWSIARGLCHHDQFERR